MPFHYIDHEADVLIVGSGDSLSRAFEEAARGVFGLMARLNGVQPSIDVAFSCSAPDSSALLVAFLNDLLFRADVEGLLFAEVDVAITVNPESGFALSAIARGEPIDYRRHDLRQEVKAATYAQARCEERDGVWVAQCVVDI